MKTNWQHIENARKTTGAMASKEGDDFGYFWMQRGRAEFGIMASSGDETIPWEHVSVKARDYRGECCPTHEELSWIKELFWNDDECVVHYYPPKSEHINNHQFVLHLWKYKGGEMPAPPSICVGIKGVRLV